jgi:hypothetical protein
MIKRSVLTLWQNLNEIKSEKSFSQKFKYFIAKNISIIRPEIEVLSEMNKPDDDFMEYEKERIKIGEQHSLKDKDGNPIITNNQFQIHPADLRIAREKLENIEAEHKVAIEKEIKRIKEFEGLLNTNYEGQSLFKIKMSEISGDNISADQLESFINCDLIFYDLEEING